MNGENLSLFERYFNQEMGEAEKKQFELRLEKDTVFRKEFEEYRSIYDAISDKEVMELRKHLKKLGDKHRDGRLGGKITGYGKQWFWLAALLIISLSIVSILYFWMSSPLTPQFLGMRLGSKNLQQEIYDLDPAYKEMVRYRVRSEDFQLKEPHDSLVVDKKSEIRFDWSYFMTEQLYFDVLNKSGELVISMGPDLPKPLILKKKFQRGVYVYRFRTASDTIYTGLFFVI
jgi:hypothetical protein